MPDFNTFPSAVVDGGSSGGSSASVTGSLGLFPLIPPIYPSRTASTVSNDVEGIIGDGDYITLPITNTGTFTYKDTAGSILFTGTNTAVDAASEVWSNFLLDPTDSLIYILSANKTTNTFYFSSIDSTGTVVNIGNFAATAVSDWAEWLTTSMTRVADGSGNFELLAAGHRVVFSVSGSLVSENTVSIGGLNGQVFKTSFDGVTIQFKKDKPGNPSETGIDLMTLLINTPAVASPEALKSTLISAPAMFMGLPAGGNNSSVIFTPLQWRGITVLWTTGGEKLVLNYGRAAFLTAMDAIITNFNFDKGTEF